MSDQVQLQSADGAGDMDPLTVLTQEDWEWLYKQLAQQNSQQIEYEDDISRHKGESAWEACQLHSCMLYMEDFYSRLKHNQSMAQEVRDSLFEGLSLYLKRAPYENDLRTLNVIMAMNGSVFLHQKYPNVLKASLHADTHLMPGIRAQLTIAWVASLEGKALAPLLTGKRSPKVLGAIEFTKSADFGRVLRLTLKQLTQQARQLKERLDKVLDQGSIGLPVRPAAGFTVPVDFLKPLRSLLSELSCGLEDDVDQLFTLANLHYTNAIKTITCTDLCRIVSNMDDLAESVDELLSEILDQSKYKEIDASLKAHAQGGSLGGHLAVQYKTENPDFSEDDLVRLAREVDTATGLILPLPPADNPFLEEVAKLNNHVIKACQTTIDQIDALIYSSKMEKHAGEVLRARMVSYRIMPLVEHVRKYLEGLKDPATRHAANEQFTQKTVDRIKRWIEGVVYKTRSEAIGLVEEKTGEAGMNMKTEEALAAIKAVRRNTEVKKAKCLGKGRAKEGAVEVHEKPTVEEEITEEAEDEEEAEEVEGAGGDDKTKPTGKKKQKKRGGKKHK